MKFFIVITSGITVVSGIPSVVKGPASVTLVSDEPVVDSGNSVVILVGAVGFRGPIVDAVVAAEGVNDSGAKDVVKTVDIVVSCLVVSLMSGTSVVPAAFVRGVKVLSLR